MLLEMTISGIWNSLFGHSVFDLKTGHTFAFLKTGLIFLQEVNFQKKILRKSIIWILTAFDISNVLLNLQGIFFIVF